MPSESSRMPARGRPVARWWNRTHIMRTMVFVDIGDLIRQARTATGWTQADLVARLGRAVGQQAVSRWEQGRSRPSRENVLALAKLLGGDEETWLGAAGYVFGESSRPSRPLVSTLPLQELQPEVFERLCADVMQALHPGAEVSLFGSRGHSQDGIDGLVLTVEDVRWTFQCKRHRQFGPAKVRAAVEAVEVEADKNVLMLSRTASPGARKEILRYSRWAIWDDEDLARKIRHEMPSDRAVRIVDTYFPGYRELFLGIPEPGPWLTTDEMFRRSVSSDLFKHSWSLVGRECVVAEILDFLAADSDSVGLLVGRAGLGKTRLLREVALALESDGVAVRFLERSNELKPESFQTLPGEAKLLIIVDDAHERGDLSFLLRKLATVHPAAKVLLALRPHGLASLASDLSVVGTHAIDLPRWDLEDLTLDEAIELASEALAGTQSERVGRLLAAVSMDCPLVAVVGGVLLRDGRLRPEELGNDKLVRETVLRGFQDAIVGKPEGGGAGLRQAVLDAICALQPFRSDQPGFRSALEKILGVPFDRALPSIRSLEDSGVILRRGSALRVVPDLLGDVILSRASVDERSGIESGYIARLVEAADDEALENLLVNVARLGWNNATVNSISEAAWEPFLQRFCFSDIRERIRLLKTVRRVAYYQPRRTIEIVNWAVANPTDRLEEASGPLNGIYAPSYQNVRLELAAVLRNVSYQFEYLPAVLDLLWELACSDNRSLNAHPDHPLRVLQELASFNQRKPISYLGGRRRRGRAVAGIW